MHSMKDILEFCVFLGGIGMLMLSLGSLIIPKLLNWNKEVRKMLLLHQQIFWTYALYILGMNLFFSIISIVAPGALINGSFLATALSLYIFLYWAGRIFIQFFYFDKSDLPEKTIYSVGEVLLLIAFFYFAVVYGWAFIYNLN